MINEKKFGKFAKGEKISHNPFPKIFLGILICNRVLKFYGAKREVKSHFEKLNIILNFQEEKNSIISIFPVEKGHKVSTARNFGPDFCTMDFAH